MQLNDQKTNKHYIENAKAYLFYHSGNRAMLIDIITAAKVF